MVFDLEGSLQRMGGDLELFRDLTEYFFADAPPLAERMAQAIEQNDAAQLERAAHSLKGLAANFGAAQVVSCAAQLEEFGRQRSAAQGARALVELHRDLATLFEQLAPFRR
jgi:HPt (histidine-containing phosphotransfer) domain-containing protein